MLPAASSLVKASPAVRLSALQAANFAWIGISMPFMPAWLASQGLSDRQIGFTLATGMIVRMLASQPVSALGDGRLGAVRVLVLLYVLSAFAYVSLLWMPGPYAIMAAMVVIAVLAAGLVPLGDHLTTVQTRADPKLVFSRIRLWGSIAFLVMNVAGGVLVARLGLGIVPVALASLCAMAAVVILFAPTNRGGVAPTPLAGFDPDDADTARLLWLALIASALINASHAALYGFGTLHWRGLGIDDATIGVLWAVAVVAEIVMFWGFGRHATRGLQAALAFLALAGLAAAIRFALLPLLASVPAILVLQCLHGLSFGAQLLGIMAIVVALSPERRRAAIQGRMSAINACMMGTMTLLSGFVYERFGSGAFFAMIPVALAGLLVLGMAALRLRRIALRRTLSPARQNVIVHAALQREP